MIEMMLTISVLAVLASVALPKYADLLIKSNEGSTKGNLGTIRSALSVYYADNAGNYPSCPAGPSSPIFNTLIPNDMTITPVVKNWVHPPTSEVYCDSMMIPGNVHDGQGWYYDGVDPQVGAVWVACDHTDTRGIDWTNY